jgi:hypothetical protein
LLKNIGLFFVACVVFALGAKVYQKTSSAQSPQSAPAAGQAPSGGPIVQAPPSAYGFVALPEPFTGPGAGIEILAPPNCPHEAGVKADGLVRDLTADGVPCSRSGNVNISMDRPPTQAETDLLNKTMLGELPIVFVNGRAKNDPSVAEIEGEFRSSARK